MSAFHKVHQNQKPGPQISQLAVVLFSRLSTFLLLYPITFQESLVLIRIPSSQTLFANQVLYSYYSIDDRFGSRRTSRYIYIHRNNLVDPLQYTIGIKNSP